MARTQADAIAPEVVATVALHRWRYFGDAGAAAAGDRLGWYNRLLRHARPFGASSGGVNGGGIDYPVSLECNPHWP